MTSLWRYHYVTIKPILKIRAQENWLFPFFSKTMPPKWIIKNDVSEAIVFNIAKTDVTYDGQISFIFANPPLIWSDDIDNEIIAIALAKLRLHPIRKNANEHRPGITISRDPRTATGRFWTNFQKKIELSSPRIPDLSIESHEITNPSDWKISLI